MKYNFSNLTQVKVFTTLNSSMSVSTRTGDNTDHESTQNSWRIWLLFIFLILSLVLSFLLVLYYEYGYLRRVCRGGLQRIVTCLCPKRWKPKSSDYYWDPQSIELMGMSNPNFQYGNPGLRVPTPEPESEVAVDVIAAATTNDETWILAKGTGNETEARYLGTGEDFKTFLSIASDFPKTKESDKDTEIID